MILFYIFAAFFLFGPFRIFLSKEFLSHCFFKSQIFVLLGSTGRYSKDQDLLVRKKSIICGEISGIQFTKRPKTSKLKMNFSEDKVQFSHILSQLKLSLFITKIYQTD